MLYRGETIVSHLETPWMGVSESSNLGLTLTGAAMEMVFSHQHTTFKTFLPILAKNKLERITATQKQIEIQSEEKQYGKNAQRRILLNFYSTSVVFHAIFSFVLYTLFSG